MKDFSVSTDFLQEAPTLSNQWTSDSLLQRYFAKQVPGEVVKTIAPHLVHVGHEVATILPELHDEAERNEPLHVPFDQFGKRIDKLVLSDAWKKLEAYAASYGIVASGYERKQAEYSRTYQAALLYLFHPSSAFATCPLAMTDGAARALELYGTPVQKERVFTRLTSRDPKTSWTSGQWMTEKTGGSDVGISKSVAVHNGNAWQLHGLKWFTSATSSRIAMALARPEGAEDGGRGLSLFMIETRDDHGKLNNIEILRLKDKLGTRAMPTAELRLHGTPAELMGGLGGGVKKISSLFNITRIYNAICALGDMRRGLALAESYSKKRVVFGKTLESHGLHQETFQTLQSDFAKCFHFTFSVSHLLGRDECGTATEEETALLRILTPLLKLYTGKKAVSITSEVLEIFGGQGYIEDSTLPRLFRNTQVFPIWEGTTNVLSLDLLRALSKEAPYEIFHKKLMEMQPSDTLKTHYGNFQKWMSSLNPEQMQNHARTVAWSMCELWTTALCESFARATNDAQDISNAKRALKNLSTLVY